MTFPSDPSRTPQTDDNLPAASGEGSASGGMEKPGGADRPAPIEVNGSPSGSPAVSPNEHPNEHQPILTPTILPPVRTGQARLVPEEELDDTWSFHSQQHFRSVLAPASTLTLVAIAIILVGLVVNSLWLTLAGSLVAIVISLRLIWPSLVGILMELSPQQQALLIAIPGILMGFFGILRISGIERAILLWGNTLRWDVLGALGDFVGAFGQIFVAMLALYVAWREYVISRDLTTQQNRITQQQTIDAFFQGISDLVLDDEGLLEDWPQERIIAEARTASILGSVDASGKAKVIRFLSRSKLLTPLQRDTRLGRPILDGKGGYAEDRNNGVRVIDLGAMLATCDLSATDLRWTDLSESNLIRANLANSDLVKANLSRTILCEANLAEADLMGARFFYGSVETASPRTRTDPPNYRTGAQTGAVVEGANFTDAKRMSEEQRQYCCAWGGSKTRLTIPGGCDDVPNRLGR